MLEGATVQCSTGHVSLKIVMKRNYLLEDSNGTSVAVLHHRTANALRALDGLHCVHYDAYVTAEEWKKGIADAKGSASSTSIDVEVNVYGPSSHAQNVGRALSDAGVYLQHPSILSTGTNYQNPHFIQFTGSRRADVEFTAKSEPAQLDTDAPRRRNVQNFLDCLDQQGELTAVTVDERIITKKLLR